MRTNSDNLLFSLVVLSGRKYVYSTIHGLQLRPYSSDGTPDMGIDKVGSKRPVGIRDLKSLKDFFRKNSFSYSDE